MKLYTYPGAPNPLRLELLLAEKGIELPTHHVDFAAKEQLSDSYRQKNPNCDVPMLELDNGTCISQVSAQCQYIEAIYPSPPMYGTSDEQRALTVMWEHLVDVNGILAAGEVLRNSSPAMENRALVGPYDYAQIPAMVERGRKRVRHYFDDLNARLERSPYVAGDFFSMADISGWVGVYFARWVKEVPGPEHTALQAWYEKLSTRPAFVGTIKRR